MVSISPHLIEERAHRILLMFQNVHKELKVNLVLLDPKDHKALPDNAEKLAQKDSRVKRAKLDLMDKMAFLDFKDHLVLTGYVAKTVYLAFLVSTASLSRAPLVLRVNVVSPVHLVLLLKSANLFLFLDQREKRVLLESPVNQSLDLLDEMVNRENKDLLVKWVCPADQDDLAKMVNLVRLDQWDLLDPLLPLLLVNQLLDLKGLPERTVFLDDMEWTAKTGSKVLLVSVVHVVTKVLPVNMVLLDPRALAQLLNALAVCLYIIMRE